MTTITKVVVLTLDNSLMKISDYLPTLDIDPCSEGVLITVFDKDFQIYWRFFHIRIYA